MSWNCHAQRISFRTTLSVIIEVNMFVTSDIMPYISSPSFQSVFLTFELWYISYLFKDVNIPLCLLLKLFTSTHIKYGIVDVHYCLGEHLSLYIKNAYLFCQDCDVYINVYGFLCAKI